MNSAHDIQTTLEQITSFHERFQRDGALIIKNAFDEPSMQLIENAYNWNLNNLGPLAQRLYPESDGTFIQCTEDSSQKPPFKAVFEKTPILDIVKNLFSSDDIWYFEDQLFFKEGDNGPARRTPWHQDTSYHPIEGEKIAVLWIPLNDISADSALEVIRGSHRKTLYNGAFFDPNDDTAPLYDEAEMPRLPDIQANRADWDIVTCAMERGDVLIFHTSTIHGGGATAPGTTRRSLSLRFVGDDVIRVGRPPIKSESPVTNNIGDKEIQFQNRLNTLESGEPVHKCGLTKL